MYLFLLDEHAKLRKIAGIIKANTFGGKKSFTFLSAEPYVFLMRNVRFRIGKRRVHGMET